VVSVLLVVLELGHLHTQCSEVLLINNYIETEMPVLSTTSVMR
jgi:hypothetical protein